MDEETDYDYDAEIAKIEDVILDLCDVQPSDPFGKAIGRAIELLEAYAEELAYQRDERAGGTA